MQNLEKLRLLDGIYCNRHTKIHNDTPAWCGKPHYKLQSGAGGRDSVSNPMPISPTGPAFSWLK